jgi:hypothetical protein
MGKEFEITEIGQILKRKDQSYKCVDIRPTQRKDGTPTRYAVLQSQCVDCGADFTCTSAMQGAVFQPNRRCDDHKAAGVSAGRSKNNEAEALALEVRRLKDENANLKWRLNSAEQQTRTLAKRLARFELNDEEGRRFAEHCANMAKERRAHLARSAQRKVSVFD